MTRYALVRRPLLTTDELSRRTGLHPHLLRRLVTFGLLDAARDSAGELWFPATAPHRVARIQRLRLGLGLDYAAIGVVLDLLDRIDDLEARLRR